MADLAWPDMPDQVLAVPVGSTEQHGPHLPLSTDTDIAFALASGLARRRSDVVVAPSMPYGASGEHAGFAGTLSIGHEALELLLVELVRSATDTFEHVVLVNGHGGNAHAGRTETSVMLALDPLRVRASREAGATAGLRELLPQLRRAGLRSVTPNGILGDPGGASADEGLALLDQALDDLEATIVSWLTAEPA